MKQHINSQHFVDANNNPTVGHASCMGAAVVWQNGPLGRGPERQEPNGAFVESVIAIAKDRLEFYQQGRFACEENAEAIRCLEAALAACESRTAKRESRAVEGTHQL